MSLEGRSNGGGKIIDWLSFIVFRRLPALRFLVNVPLKTRCPVVRELSVT